MSKRVTLSDSEIAVISNLFNEALNGYYSDANIDELDLEDRVEASYERVNIISILKKIQ